MNEQVVGRQQRLYMAYNLVAFTLIFGMFGFIIYSQIRTSLFSQVDAELHRSRQAVLERAGFLDDQLGFQQDFLEPRGEVGHGEKQRPFLSMRILTIVRDAQGQVLNSQALGRAFWETWIDEIAFSPAEAGAITTLRAGGQSVLRSLVFEYPNEAETYYVQLIINVDGEQGIIDSFLNILIACVAVFVLLSITASYLLSKQSMVPLLRSWRRQTEFVENASHELRTPLTIIQNKLETLLSTPQATILEKADSLAVTLSETRRLSKLTGDLMTLARADSAQTLLEKEPFELDELIRSIHEPYAELFELEDKTLRLDLHCGQVVRADRGRIHELIIILLDNALKYTRPGDETVIRTSFADNRALLEVQDTGIGIAKESLERIFDRFYREDKARSRECGGSGLGLSIAKWIVDSHGGQIKALSNQPRGTVFLIRLPK